MVEDKNYTDEQKVKIIDTYEYYFTILDLMLSDMSKVSLNDIQDVVDEVTEEIKKIEGKQNEMSTNKRG